MSPSSWEPLSPFFIPWLDPDALLIPTPSRAAAGGVLNTVSGCLMALTAPRAVLTRFSLPRAAASLQHPSPHPTPRRKPRTKATGNKNQERGSGRRGLVADQSDPQEEIIETRLRHVPGDGMWRGDISPGSVGRDQTLAGPTLHVQCCWLRWQGMGDIRKRHFW